MSGILYGVTNTQAHTRTPHHDLLEQGCPRQIACAFRCATLTGIYGVGLTATLIDYGFDWSFPFDLVACLYLLSAAAFLQFGDVVKVFP